MWAGACRGMRACGRTAGGELGIEGGGPVRGCDGTACAEDEGTESGDPGVVVVGRGVDGVEDDDLVALGDSVQFGFC